MIIDLFGSLKENLIKKVRNPFFGTFTVVFVLKNWQLFYSLLFFDSADTRTTRIEILEKYIADSGGTWQMFGWAVLCTFGVLITSYLLQGLGAYISNFYDSILDPLIMKWATKGASIVTLANHEKEKRRGDLLEQKLKEERIKRLDAETRADQAEKRLLEDQQKTKDIPSESIMQENTDIEIIQKLVEQSKSIAEKISDKICDTQGWRKGFTAVLSQIHQGAQYPSINLDDLSDYLYSHRVLEMGKDQIHLSKLGVEVKEIFLEKTM